jgi:hypothetical protein
MSGGITFGATITGSIQNVAGILPLLGTQQYEDHVGSALTKGHLYAAATPMSIFGSLGLARAGFKALIACMSGRTWSGATILANMGFEPKGTNLSLVMIDKDDKDGRHLAETRLDELVKELNIDKSRFTVSHKCTRWNVTMIILTAFLSLLSIIPYIHMNLRDTNLTHFSQWTFPILRAAGGFLTASIMQIVIERRIARLTARHLAKSKSETLVHTSEGPGECQAIRATPHVLQRSMSHKNRGEMTAQMQVPGVPVAPPELETSSRDWVSLTDPILPVIAGRQSASLATPFLPNTIDTASWRNAALDSAFLVLLLAAFSFQWSATWVVLASCRMRDCTLAL